jgi:dolichol kinase
MTVDKKVLLKEIFRKLIHLISAVIPFLLKIAYWPVIIGFLVIVVLYYICELLRLEGHPVPLISLITNLAARERDEGKIVLGPITLVLGILFVALVLPLDYAKVGIYALSFGDGLASLVGKLCGKHKIPKAGGKTFEGSLACFIAVFISTWCVTRRIGVSLLVALLAMFIEVLPLADFDNLMIPITISSFYMFLVQVM